MIKTIIPNDKLIREAFILIKEENIITRKRLELLENENNLTKHRLLMIELELVRLLNAYRDLRCKYDKKLQGKDNRRRKDSKTRNRTRRR